MRGLGPWYKEGRFWVWNEEGVALSFPKSY